MCDTFVALRNATRDGSVIFGKNSDREPNEAHQVVLIPHTKHEKGSMVECTYISIPQVEETNAVLLSKPFWLWGAEMGANEHGVVIGNEAVFTKVPYEKAPGLIGMDFLRLALERASTADEALDVMIGLLEVYGQGGNCGFAHQLFYHNGFLIADRDSAWVFETAGKQWAAERVKDVRSISNIISIGSSWDRASDDLVDHAIKQGWCKSVGEFDFCTCYSDFIFTKFSAGSHRLCRTETLLRENLGQIDVPFAMQLLRDHGPDASSDWRPDNGLFGAEVCMHASFGPIRISQTTGSMVSHLGPEQKTHWVTGTAAPCTSIFKPVWLDAGLPDFGPDPSGVYDQATYWWRHENLHRELLKDYDTRILEIEHQREPLETRFLSDVAEALQESTQTRRNLTSTCFDRADQAESQWVESIKGQPIQKAQAFFHKKAWKRFDREAQRPG